METRESLKKKKNKLKDKNVSHVSTQTDDVNNASSINIQIDTINIDTYNNRSKKRKIGSFILSKDNSEGDYIDDVDDFIVDDDYEDEDADFNEDDEDDEYDEEDDFEDDFGEDIDQDNDDELDTFFNINIWLNKVKDEDLKRILKEEKKYKNDKDKIMTNFVKKCSFSDLKYMKKLSVDEKVKYAVANERITKDNNDEIPMKFKILSSDLSDDVKSIIIRKADNLASMSPTTGEYNKMKNWLTSICSIPFGKYKKILVDKTDGSEKITEFLNNTKNILNDNVYGHNDAKDQIIRIIAQWISNPKSKGNVIGIHGAAGVGKTTLIKDGLSEALNLPFQFIGLGGTSDSSFLEGHSFTYEGSTYGKIAELLMQSKYMNPIIYFDELDKVSDTAKGQEIINLLIHITDSSQNDKFHDKYFSEVPFDLSKCLFVFTYNDDSLINPILKDRMIRIDTKEYKLDDKIQIAKKYLIPSLYKQFDIDSNNIEFSNGIIQTIIENTDDEAGVRNLKRNLESIISNINLNYLMNLAKYPIKIDEEIIDKYCKKKQDEFFCKLPSMYT